MQWIHCRRYKQRNILLSADRTKERRKTEKRKKQIIAEEGMKGKEIIRGERERRRRQIGRNPFGW